MLQNKELTSVIYPLLDGPLCSNGHSKRLYSVGNLQSAICWRILI